MLSLDTARPKDAVAVVIGFSATGQVPHAVIDRQPLPANLESPNDGHLGPTGHHL
jgi:hypothetical protein